MNTIEIVFEWLLTATLRASALAVVILGIQFVLRHRLPAAWHHALWLPMLAVLVLPALPEAPFALLPPKVKHSVVVDKVMEQIPATFDFSASEIVSASPAATPSVVDKRNVFPMLWLAGACLVLAAGAIGYVRNMRQIRLSATSPDSKLQAIIEEAANKAGLKRAPQTLISPAVASPAVTGLVRPVLLLPDGFPEGFSAMESRLILLHEFTHLKRFDLPVNWLLCVLQAMHWFNPLLWLAFARMRADREAACDARVLSIETTDRRSEYGGALLKLQCTTPSRFLSLGFVGIFERGSGIKSRILGIANYHSPRFVWKAAGGAIFTLLMLFGVTHARQPEPSSDGKEKEVDVTPGVTQNTSGKERIQQQLDTIIIPTISFRDATVEQAFQVLHQHSKNLDVNQPDPQKRGVNFVLGLPESSSVDPKITLQLQNVPLLTALQFICDAGNLQYTVGDHAVAISAREMPGVDPADPASGNPAARELLVQKLDSITIPSINFTNASVADAIQFLRQRSQAHDTSEPDPQKRGVNFVLRLPDPTPADPMITMQFQDVPLLTALQLICDAANLHYTVGDQAVIISPKDK